MKLLKRLAFGLLGAVMAVLVTATVLEKIYGTDFAAAHIYGAGWFAALWGVLTLAALACLFRRKLWRRPAVLLLHLSFAVILAGASVTWLFGRQGTLHLRTGDPGATAFAGRDGSEQILPFRARLDDFRIEYYAGTRAPMDFVSLLTLTADDGSLHGEVGMNRILVFRNYRFYQSAYDEDGRGTTLSVSYDPWGIGITTEQVNRKTQVEVEATLANRDKDLPATLLCTVTELDGHTILTQKETVTLEANRTSKVKLQFPFENAKLWSPETPNLYRMVCCLVPTNGEPADTVTTTFGVRHVEYSAKKGLILNGKAIELNGGCVHHDNGPLGAASYRDAEWRKAQLMKEAGFNAVRTSHNPPAEAFLDACDHLGLLVIDESFDGWRSAKTPKDYSILFDRWWTKDIESMVLRDRNHPSIFCWSIGNEIIERKTPEAVLTAYALAGHVRRLDPSRPVTSALAAWDKDWEIYDPLAAAHDIVGYNYMMHKGPSDHERVPSRIMMQTESYPRDAFANWARVNDHSYIIGDFVWTAIDYLGESGIGRFYYKGESEGEHYHRNQFPWHGAYCGDIDLTGLRKPISYYREMLFNPEKKLYMAVKEPTGYYGEIKETLWSVWPTWESWNWPGHEGKDIDVEVYSHYPSVRLYLNDRLIGEKPTTRTQEFKAIFTLPYAPGTLRIVGVENGRETESRTLETAGKPARIRLTADRTEISADGESLVYVIAEITDKQGRVVPNADNLLTFELQGSGTLLATCSADLKDCTAYTAPERKAWKGRAMAVVKSGKEKGRLTLTVKGKGVKKASVGLDLK